MVPNDDSTSGNASSDSSGTQNAGDTDSDGSGSDNTGDGGDDSRSDDSELRVARIATFQW